MARDILFVLIFTVASRSTFSTSGRVLELFRSSSSVKIVEALICAQDWLRMSNQLVSIEENIEEVERLETELTNGNVGGGHSLDQIIVKHFLYLLNM
ncbi:unnamed protein product [Cuscuta europaea]|uniref:HAT C-terminal dimerisation domain-containing protein n=1 Tax=Cuscuta europaea TaxID=41803 RepID=A0A9P0ZYL7_CUSEU|nr:unnamed protein product [Cuscuta europaea]